MSIKATLVKIRDAYVMHQVQSAKIPSFESDVMHRYQVIFSGRVQKVGFRMELCEMAKRLGLTGYCRNLENGEVLAQLQGPENKIQYLLTFMESLIRIRITDKKIEELELNKEEREFIRV